MCRGTYDINLQSQNETVTVRQWGKKCLETFASCMYTLYALHIDRYKQLCMCHCAYNQLRGKKIVLRSFANSPIVRFLQAVDFIVLLVAHNLYTCLHRHNNDTYYCMCELLHLQTLCRLGMGCILLILTYMWT